MTKKTEPIVIKATDVAVMLSISRAQVYVLAERGELRRVRIGDTRSIRFLVADVYALLGINPPD